MIHNIQKIKVMPFDVVYMNYIIKNMEISKKPLLNAFKIPKNDIKTFKNE